MEWLTDKCFVERAEAQTVVTACMRRKSRQVRRRGARQTLLGGGMGLVGGYGIHLAVDWLNSGGSSPWIVPLVACGGLLSTWAAVVVIRGLDQVIFGARAEGENLG